MGKPFDHELSILPETYEWAGDVDITGIAQVLRRTWYFPLISVGSGGSLSAAEFQTTLQRSFFCSLAHALTPMELIYSLPRDGHVSVWFMSASGNNVDVRRAFQHAALLEPKCVSGVVGREKTKLAELANRYQYTNLFEYCLPWGKDGFLATNSLLAFSILMYRAYCAATGHPEALQKSLNELVSENIAQFTSFHQTRAETQHIWEKDVLHILFSLPVKSVAVDIESKFIEAGLGSIHLADIRSFAHGRHHWFNKNADNSALLALTTQQDAELGRQTLGLLPSHIQKHQMVFNPNNGQEVLAGLVFSMHLASWRGKARQVDPGRPGVPSYGSKIYRLTAKSGFVTSETRRNIAIERKMRHGPFVKTDRRSWEQAYKEFLKRLRRKPLGAVVLDYDGTLVDARRRKEPPDPSICIELARLLDLGLVIGIATGRGKSVGEALRNPETIPTKKWHRVLIGYYNGSEIAVLSNTGAPDKTGPQAKELREFGRSLRANNLVLALNCDITERKRQTSVEPDRVVSETYLWDVAQDEKVRTKVRGIDIVRSSHSIDILASGVTKLAVVEHIQNRLGKTNTILTIGDRGRWPGNDATLLNWPNSLSVDETSLAQDRCWNLAPAGIKGPQATLHYLRRIVEIDGRIIFK